MCFPQLFEHGRLRFTNHSGFSLSRVADCYHHGPCTWRKQHAVSGAGSHELQWGFAELNHTAATIVPVPGENSRQLAALVHMSLTAGFCRTETRHCHHGPCTWGKQQAVSSTSSHELQWGFAELSHTAATSVAVFIQQHISSPFL